MNRALVLVAALATPCTVFAGTVSPTLDIEFQALTLDIIAGNANVTTGLDASSTFNYNGTFDQTGWNGTLGGVYMSQAVSGTSAASITGDPDWQISGTVTAMNVLQNYKLIMLQDPNDPTMITVSNQSFIGGNTLMGNLTEKITDATASVLTGKLTESVNGVGIEWDVTIQLDLKSNKITSSYKSNRGNFTDNGKYTLKLLAGNFNGAMNVDVATVPEPSGLALLTFGMMIGLRCWHVQRRRVASRPSERCP